MAQCHADWTMNFNFEFEFDCNIPVVMYSRVRLGNQRLGKQPQMLFGAPLHYIDQSQIDTVKLCYIQWVLSTWLRKGYIVE